MKNNTSLFEKYQHFTHFCSNHTSTRQSPHTIFLDNNHCGDAAQREEQLPKRVLTAKNQIGDRIKKTMLGTAQKIETFCAKTIEHAKKHAARIVKTALRRTERRCDGRCKWRLLLFLRTNRTSSIVSVVHFGNCNNRIWNFFILPANYSYCLVTMLVNVHLNF